MKFIFTILILFSCKDGITQFIVSGKITNSKLEPVAYASIQVKEMKFGTVSKEDGSYRLQLEEGNYDLIISIVGYKTQVISLIVNKETIQNILLENDNSKNLNEVAVLSHAKDKAEQIIRNVIQQKETILSASGPYSCDIYIKAVQQNSKTRNGKQAKQKDSARNKTQSELADMSMAEIILKLDVAASQKIKEERTAVKKTGNAESLFYLSSTEGDFNLYNNLLKVPAVSVIPFLSPISFSGLLAYKYKTIGIRRENNKKIYTIRFAPRSSSNATLDGEVDIADSSWTILSSRFTLPENHTPEYDHFEVQQQYELVSNAWMITKQEFVYSSKFGKTKSSGNSIVLYSNFILNRPFPRNYFGNEVSATAQAAYEKDSSFWDKARAVPLTDKEIAFIHFKDSVFRATHTKQYLDSIDKKTNAITAKKLLLEGVTFYNRQKERTIFIDAIPSLYRPVNFGGPRIGYDAHLFKTYKSKKNISLMLDVDYGLRNKDLKGSISINRMYNPFNRGYFHIEAGRSFDFIFQNDSYINVLKRSNVYEHDNFKIGHGIELLNGLFLNNELEFAVRRSVAGYKTNAGLDSSFIGRDILTNNKPVYFPKYNAFYNSITLSFTAAQRFIREPKEKIILGSSFPTAHVTWRKGIPNLFQSAINFDYLEFGLNQTIRFGLAGIGQYTITSGSFLKSTNLQLVDYKFERRGDPFLLGNPGRSFQALDSTFPVFHRFYEGHYIHEFNGAILSKIPLLRKLKLLEVVGGGFLFTQERNLHYVEAFAGLEKQVKFFRDRYKIGIYVAGSAANQFKSAIQFKLGIEKFDRKRNSWY